MSVVQCVCYMFLYFVICFRIRKCLIYLHKCLSHSETGNISTRFLFIDKYANNHWMVLFYFPSFSTYRNGSFIDHSIRSPLKVTSKKLLFKNEYKTLIWRIHKFIVCSLKSNNGWTKCIISPRRSLNMKSMTQYIRKYPSKAYKIINRLLFSSYKLKKCFSFMTHESLIVIVWPQYLL